MEKKKLLWRKVFWTVATVIVYLLIFLPFYQSRIDPLIQNFGEISMNSAGEKLVTTSFQQNTQVVQPFFYDGRISGIKVRFATYQSENNPGSLTLSILQKGENEPLISVIKKLSSIDDNEMTEFLFSSEITLKNDVEYQLLITMNADFTDQSQLTVYYTEDKDKNSSFELGPFKKYYGTVNFSLLEKMDFVKKEFTFLACMGALVLLLGMLFLCIYQRPLHQVFLFVMLPLSLMYQICLPPFSVPDEDAHYATAYQYSNVLFGVPQEAAGDGQEEIIEWQGEQKIVYRYIPCREEDQSIEALSRYPNLKTYQYIEKNFGKSTQKGGQGASTFAQRPTTIAAIVYLPSLLGISLGRIFGADFVTTVYLGRFFNQVIYILLCTWAIRSIPVMKTALFLVASLPMALHLAASYSYDAILYSAIFLLFAKCLERALEYRQIPWIETLIFLPCILVISTTKPNYLPLALLFFLIPRRNFRSLKDWWASILLMAATSAGGILVMSTVQKSASVNAPAVATVATYQLSDIFSHPLQVLALIWDSFLEYADHYFITLLGGRPGWIDIVVPWTLMIGFASLLLLASFARACEDCLTVKKSFWITRLVALLCLGATVAAVLTWTPVDAEFLFGLQGRYLLPLLPLIGPLFSETIRVKSEKNLSVPLLILSLYLHQIYLINVLNVTLTR